MMTQLSNKTVVKSQALQIGHLPVTYEYNMF